MAIRELTSSRNITYNEGQPIGIREFHCHPYVTEADVVALIGAIGGLPGKMAPWPVGTFPLGESVLRVFDHAIRRDPNVTQAWIVTVTYRQRSPGASLRPGLGVTPQQPGAATIRLDYNAQFEDAWRQWPTTDDLRASFAVLDGNQVPRFAQFTPESDIGGRKIDTAGYPTSVLRHTARLTVDVLDLYEPSFGLELIGTRNNREFLRFPQGTVLFMGCSALELPTGLYNASYEFNVDFLFHLKQIPKRQANGYVVLDLPGNPDDQMATGQAKVVSYVQPYPIVTDHYRISSRFGDIT